MAFRIHFYKLCLTSWSIIFLAVRSVVTFKLFTSFSSHTLRLFYTLDQLEIFFKQLVVIIWYKIYFNKYFTCYSR